LFNSLRTHKHFYERSIKLTENRLLFEALQITKVCKFPKNYETMLLINETLYHTSVQLTEREDTCL